MFIGDGGDWPRLGWPGRGKQVLDSLFPMHSTGFVLSQHRASFFSLPTAAVMRQLQLGELGTASEMC
jgi:hypothetical protein